ncbi:MAG: TatD family deoxyribonuclease [Ruminococcaceae bacterium]|nr:TatD family deoxyribonuclease [Oscillospiraceae bacterium]
MLFDTHAHLLDERFDGEREDIINALPSNGVGAYCEIGYDIKSSINATSLANKFEYVYASVGVHPHDTDSLTEDDLNTIKNLCKEEKVVAIGEIGLDYYYDNSKRENQRFWFDRQLSLAEEINIPITVHTRDAMADTIDILKCHKNAEGIIHCYSGSKESAKILLDMGFFISFAGPLTFKNASTALEVAKYVPSDRMLIETDSPYLAPVPYRGKRNEPSFVAEVAKRLSEIRGISFEEVSLLTFENAKNVYRIK